MRSRIGVLEYFRTINKSMSLRALKSPRAKEPNRRTRLTSGCRAAIRAAVILASLRIWRRLTNLGLAERKNGFGVTNRILPVAVRVIVSGRAFGEPVGIPRRNVVFVKS